MYAASIIHVGDDGCCRIPVLKSAGYFVTKCTSIAQLHMELIRIPPVDALAVAESFGDLLPEAVSLARATTSIPLILFRCADRCLDEADFDLVVPPLTGPTTWVTDLQQLIEKYHAIRARTEALHEDVKSLRERFLILREECAAAVEESRLESEQFKRNRQG